MRITVVHISTGIGCPTGRLQAGKHVVVKMSIWTNHLPSYMSYGQVMSVNRRSKVG